MDDDGTWSLHVRYTSGFYAGVHTHDAGHALHAGAWGTEASILTELSGRASILPNP